MDNRVECIEKPFIHIGNHSYLLENVGKFNLGNRICIPRSESRTLEEDGKKMDVRNVGEGEMSSRILADNA